MINFKEQTFGIEIETTELSRTAAAIAIQNVIGGEIGHENSYDASTVTTADGRVWKAVKDSSLHSSNGMAAEIVSPICAYEDIETVQAIVRAVKAAGARVNCTCGIHVHVGVPGITGKELANLVKVVDKQEEYLFKALGVLESRKDCFARPVDTNLITNLGEHAPKTALQFKRMWYGVDANYSDAALENYNFHHYHPSRYHGLNLHATFTKGTVEYRYFNGSLHPGKIKAYIQFCLALTAYGRNSRGAKAGRREFKAESAKYDFRVFLTSLGLNGKEFEVCRLHMLNRLSGDSAYKHGRPLAMAA
jgi:hypothetical protein